MNVLTVNCGSSSIKLKAFDAAGPSPIAAEAVERIGETTGRRVSTRLRAGGTAEVVEREVRVADHREGLALLLAGLPADLATAPGGDRPGGVDVVAHRIVHGGTRFDRAVVADDEALRAIRGLEALAPLHNPFGLLGIEAAREVFPAAVQVAVFDTAFHRTLPPRASTYALPLDLRERLGVRRYGFHGISHQHVAREAARFLGRPLDDTNLVSLHLGAGASATAVVGGRSVDTTMGMTPLEGLAMASRCGDIDPAVPFHLMRRAGLSADAVEDLLNNASGLLGLCGTKDMREVERRLGAGDEDAAAAFELFCYRVRKAVGSFLAVIGRADAVVFTGGIGEHSAAVRERCCEGLDALGVQLDAGKNRAASGGTTEIQAAGSRVRVLVIPADEELEMARQALDLVAATGAPQGGRPRRGR